MEQHQSTFTVATRLGLTDITDAVRQALRASGLRTGLCTIYLRHTSASLIIQENADPAVLRDLGAWLARLAPESDRWEHADEGRDDMPAHARSVITRPSEGIPIVDGALALGTWQAIYLWEHRARGRTRRVVVQIVGA